VATRAGIGPHWLPGAAQVEDVFSVSYCLSEPFGGYIHHWQHNGFWLFDDPALMRSIAAAVGIELGPMTLFYYEAYEQELNDASTWSPAPEGGWSDLAFGDFPTAVVPPAAKELQGFDVVCHMTSVADPGCSPLSCNGIAAAAAVNRHCLFDTLEQARAALDSGQFANTEPGSKRIIAVYTVPAA
jgi:hypothetical protein